MNSSVKNALYASCMLLALFSAASPGQAAVDWKVVKVGPRDYLTLNNIAAFYSLPVGIAPVQNKVRLDNGHYSLEVLRDSREVLINGVRNWLCFPVVERDGNFLLSRVDLAKTLEPQLRPQMIPNVAKFTTVVLDPGHGGHDKGAGSPYGFEKDYALDVAKQLKPLLEAKGLKVVMTRTDDTFIPLEVRARIANNTPDSIFVSIHFNATDMNPAATGFEIYSLTPRGAPSTQDDALALYFLNMQAGSPVDAPSLALSSCVYHSMLGQIPEFDRGVKRARFAVLRLTKSPAILVEGGFVTERGESRLIANGSWRGKLASAIATGVENYKLLAEKRQRPLLIADYRKQIGALAARDGVKQPENANSYAQLVPGSDLSTAPTHEGTAAAAGEPKGEAAAVSGPTEPTIEVPSTSSLAVSNRTIPAQPQAAEEEEAASVQNLPPAPVPEESVASLRPAAPDASPGSVPAVAVGAPEVGPRTPPKRVWWLGPFPKFQP